jgi:hypothetical protein
LEIGFNTLKPVCLFELQSTQVSWILVLIPSSTLKPMSAFPDDAVLIEFRRECTVRRTAQVLETKRKRIQEDLRQLVQHLGLLVPTSAAWEEEAPSQAIILKEALARLGDEGFAQLVLALLED